MTRLYITGFFVVALAAIVAGCGGGGGGTSPALPAGGATSVAQATPFRVPAGWVAASLTVTTSKSTDARRRPQFINPCAAWIGVTASPHGVAPSAGSEQLVAVNFQISHASSATVSVQAPPGNDDFIINAYSANGGCSAPASAPVQYLLSTNDSPQVPASQQTFNVLSNGANAFSSTLLPLATLAQFVNAAGVPTIYPLENQGAQNVSVLVVAYDALGVKLSGALANSVTLSPPSGISFTDNGTTATSLTNLGDTFVTVWNGAGFAPQVTSMTPTTLAAFSSALQPVAAQTFTLQPDYYLFAASGDSTASRLDVIDAYNAGVTLASQAGNGAPNNTSITVTRGPASGCAAGATAFVPTNSTNSATIVSAAQSASGAIVLSTPSPAVLISGTSPYLFQSFISAGCTLYVSDNANSTVDSVSLNPFGSTMGTLQNYSSTSQDVSGIATDASALYALTYPISGPCSSGRQLASSPIAGGTAVPSPTCAPNGADSPIMLAGTTLLVPENLPGGMSETASVAHSGDTWALEAWSASTLNQNLPYTSMPWYPNEEALSPDSKTLYLNGNGNILTLDLSNLVSSITELGRFAGTSSTYIGLALSPDGTRISSIEQLGTGPYTYQLDTWSTSSLRSGAPSMIGSPYPLPAAADSAGFAQYQGLGAGP